MCCLAVTENWKRDFESIEMKMREKESVKENKKLSKVIAMIIALESKQE